MDVTTTIPPATHVARRACATARIPRAAALLAVVAAVTVTPADAAACPNEQLRAENHSLSLPDCRAYEQVTPPFKFGQAVGAPRGEVAAAGSAIGFVSIGSFGEAMDSPTFYGSAYVGARASSGWGSTAVDPSASQFQTEKESNPQDYSADLTRAVLLKAPNSRPIDMSLYLHTPGTASPGALIGPTVPNGKVAAWTLADAERGNQPQIFYAGGSADLSHVLFSSQNGEGNVKGNWLWPGDSSLASSSLYEYVGIGGSEPELVAIKPGPEEANNRPAGHPHLITQCGVILGGPPVPGEGSNFAFDDYNAVSEDGATIFFTALSPNPENGCKGFNEQNETVAGVGPSVNEVYARINGSRTVAISEPTKQDCSECDTEPADQRAAAYQGASRDGSKVFFLSQQKLLPGASGDNLYMYDRDGTAGHRVTLVAPRLKPSGSIENGQGGVARVAEEGGIAYFVSEGVLASNDDTNNQQAVAGADNLYVFAPNHNGLGQSPIAFIAPLSSADEEDWSISDAARPVEATPDGRFLLFLSVNDLTPDASGTGEQLYRYDSATAQLIRVTSGEAGFNNNGNSAPFWNISDPGESAVARALPQAVNISSDGTKIFFSGPAALTPTALNEACAFKREGTCRATASNVYEWQNGHVYLLSDGQDTHTILGSSAVTLIGANASGSDVFFTTSDSLVPTDTDTQQDIYDAREGGGFPAPVSPAGCQGEACQGPESPPPLFTVPGSTTLVAPGSATSSAPSTSPSSVPAAKKLTRAQKLAKALQVCRKRTHGKHKRAICEKNVRKKHRTKATAKVNRGGK
jgi:hypothetical protein